MTTARITSPGDPALAELCQQLAELAPRLEDDTIWPSEQLNMCGQYGVYEWFLPVEMGGQGWSQTDIFRGYLQLSAACLTTTFIITQRMGACRRIAYSENDVIKKRLLPNLISGKTFASVGISHLTTSRRHMSRPVLRAEETGNGFLLSGFSPWVTGSPYAQTVVTGATMADGRQLLVALPTDLFGVSTPPPARLVGVSASATGEVRCDRVEIGREWLLAGPIENVMKQGIGASSGGLQTSTLAIGLADAAIKYIEEESIKREELATPARALRSDWLQARDDLLALADGEPVCSNEELRIVANSLALRASQASLAAAKGTGFVLGHPAGRWCREALFFLVWSCPQPVMAANLCELAGLE